MERKVLKVTDRPVGLRGKESARKIGPEISEIEPQILYLWAA